MDDEQGSKYRVSHLTEEERAQVEKRARQEVAHLTGEELNEHIRRGEAELDVLCIKFAATASVIVDILQGLIQGVTNVAASLAAINAPWAQMHGRELCLEAVQLAKISRRDREGKVLLGIPKDIPARSA
jgi:hypothetical protein